MLWFPHVGRRQWVTELATGQRVITTYWSVSVLFVFGFTFRYAHYLNTIGPKPLSDMEIHALVPGGRVPRPPFWQRFGLFVFVALIVAFVWWVKATEG